jgi:putative toxin-antitoxin system antitoxin component (TIGR02293 family)
MAFFNPAFSFGDGSGALDVVDQIREGLPANIIDETLQSGRLTAAELDRLAIPRKTVAHRRKLGRLTAEQSDRLLRVLRVVEEAETSFANPEKAHRWLRRPTDALAGRPPLDLLDTDIGARLVERLLGRIAHGLAA